MLPYDLQGKKIVLGVCGGIAAYKSVELLRLLVKQGADIRVIMTANAEKFVAPMTFEALSGRKVCSDLFAGNEEATIGHIQWAMEADAVVIAPATANFLGKFANGIADDALSTFMLAVTCTTIICPSMNSNMLDSRPVQRNIETVKRYGHLVLEPSAGELACGTSGPGRLPDPQKIVDFLVGTMTPKDFRGKNILVTAGPTREAIDPVRFISNPSTGKMGYAIAKAAEQRGANVMLITGPTALAPPDNVRTIRVETASQMAGSVLDYMQHADIIIKTAAVSDYRPSSSSERKLKKSEENIQLTLERTKDILKEVGRRKTRQVLVGFAAETHELENYALKKLKAKNLDIIVANKVGVPEAGFASDNNQGVLFFRDGSREDLELMPKEKMAHLLLDRIISLQTNNNENR